MFKFSDLDLYRKIPKDLTEASSHGACLSLVGIVFMLGVFMMELWAFLSVNYTTDVILDPNTEKMIRVSFDISVFDLPCDYVSLDVVDVLGTRKEGVTQNINKWGLNKHGVAEDYKGRNDDNSNLLKIDEHHNLDDLKKDGEQAVHVDAENFDNYLAQNKYVFANFYAPWCIWCQRLEPVWEALAEKIEKDGKPVSIIKIDCVKNHHFCIQHRVQAFPTLRFYTGGEDHMMQYQSDRTVEALDRFIDDMLDKDHFVKSIADPEERARAHQERIDDSQAAQAKNVGCNLVGFLFVNRVPGNFHLLARSENHNMNPAMANLTHRVNNLFFGNVMTPKVKRLVDRVPTDLFNQSASLAPMNGQAYGTQELHKAYHHYLKIVSTHFMKGQYNEEGAAMAYQMLVQSQVMVYNEDEVPEARFSFDLSPMAVVISRQSMQLYEFVTHICALIGGTFTVIGLFSGALNFLFKSKKM